MRSMLFVPADSERKLHKCCDTGTDAVILDLEDSVVPTRKAEARKMAVDFLYGMQEKSHLISLWVRINSLDTDLWMQDLEAVVPAAPHGLLIPKPRSGDDVARLSRELDKLEAAADIPAGAIKLLPIVTETAVSVIKLHTYIDCSARVSAMSWGAEDLPADLGAISNRDENDELTSIYKLARDLCLLTSVAAGAQAIDTVYTNFRNEEGLKQECDRAARDGYTGKMAIHPAQIATINHAFTPAQDDIIRAKRIVEAFHARPGAGVISLNGEMLDRPHLIRAERLLSRARHTKSNKS